MGITIEEINSKNVSDVNKCDNVFIIDSRLVLSVDNNAIHYTIADVPRTNKQYGKDNVDYSTYIGRSGQGSLSGLC